MEDQHHLLLCTVGGTADPVIASIRKWKPARVLLIPSTGSTAIADEIEKKIDLLPPGAWERIELHDAEDFGGCVRSIRSLDEQVRAWRRRGPGYEVIVDFTGGTKCMSAALSLVS